MVLLVRPQHEAPHSSGARIARNKGATVSAKLATVSPLRVRATALRSMVAEEEAQEVPIPSGHTQQEPSAVDAFAMDTDGGPERPSATAASAAVMPHASEAMLAALRRKELQEIHLRIAETLALYDTKGRAAGGEDDDGQDDGEEDSAEKNDLAFSSIMDNLMVLLMDYLKTCNSRKSLLATMDAGLTKLLKDAEKEQAKADAASSDPSSSDAAEQVLMEQQGAKPVDVLAADTNERKQVLRGLHEQQVSMLQEHISSIESPLAASEQRGAQLEAEVALVLGRASRANADMQALVDEVQSLEGQGKATAQRLKERDNSNEAKTRTQLGSQQQMKADFERERMRAEQLDASLQGLEARHKEELAALQSSLKDALAQRDAAQAELPSLQEQLAAARSGQAGSEELQTALDEARQQLAEQKSSALRMHETLEARRNECVAAPPALVPGSVTISPFEPARCACLLRSIEAEREAERKTAQTELAGLTLKMDGLRQQMQKQEKEFQEREAKMLGSGTDDISKLRGELEAANAHLRDVQQVCTYMIYYLSMFGPSRSR